MQNVGKMEALIIYMGRYKETLVNKMELIFRKEDCHPKRAIRGLPGGPMVKLSPSKAEGGG